MQNVACSAPGFLDAVKQACVGRASCSLQPGLVPDPCSGTYKWANFTLKCAPLPSGSMEPLPAGLVPEVAHFDSAEGLFVTSGAVQSWQDVEPTRATNVLRFTAGCSAQSSAGAVTFSGSCLGRMSTNLPATWGGLSTAPFTAVWIGRFEANPATTKQALIHLSRTPTDVKRELVMSSNELFIHETNNLTVTSGNVLTNNPAPTSVWTMEVLVRSPGATSATYYRAAEGAARVSSWPLASVPSAIDGDTLVIGGDYRDSNSYMRGQVAAVLLFNRSLSAANITSLALHYKPRFGLLTGSMEPLPAGLVPEVAHFDGAEGLSVTSGAVQSWQDVEPTRATNLLRFTAGCSAQSSAGAVTFSGSCLGRMSTNLPATWSGLSTAPFTAVWIGRFEANPATTRQALIHLSRTPTDVKRELVMSSNELFIHETNNLTVTSGNLLTDKPAPTSVWTMEVLVRNPGATSVTYYRAREGAAQVSSWPLASAPSAIDGDNLVIGGDYRDSNSYMRGQVAAVLLFNRSLSAANITSLALHYKPRFGLMTADTGNCLKCPGDCILGPVNPATGTGSRRCDLNGDWRMTAMSSPNQPPFYRLDSKSKSVTSGMVDGCSSPTSLQYMGTLNPACNAHDLCYRCRDTPGWGLSRLECDVILGRVGNEMCGGVYNQWYDHLPLGFGRYEQCVVTSAFMYTGLRVADSSGWSIPEPGECHESWRPYIYRGFIVGKPAEECNTSGGVSKPWHAPC